MERPIGGPFELLAAGLALTVGAAGWRADPEVLLVFVACPALVLLAWNPRSRLYPVIGLLAGWITAFAVAAWAAAFLPRHGTFCAPLLLLVCGALLRLRELRTPPAAAPPAGGRRRPRPAYARVPSTTSHSRTYQRAMTPSRT